MSLALSRAVDYEATVLSSRVPWLEHRTLVYDMIFFMGIILQSTYIETTSYIELACGIESEQRLILKVSTVNYRTSAAFQSAHRVWVYLLLQEAFFVPNALPLTTMPPHGAGETSSLLDNGTLSTRKAFEEYDTEASR
jgi:hypothetical protein